MTGASIARYVHSHTHTFFYILKSSCLPLISSLPSFHFLLKIFVSLSFFPFFFQTNDIWSLLSSPLSSSPFPSPLFFSLLSSPFLSSLLFYSTVLLYSFSSLSVDLLPLFLLATHCSHLLAVSAPHQVRTEQNRSYCFLTLSVTDLITVLTVMHIDSVLSSLVLTCLHLFCLVLGSRVLFCLVLPCLVLSCLVFSSYYLALLLLRYEPLEIFVHSQLWPILDFYVFKII